ALVLLLILFLFAIFVLLAPVLGVLAFLARAIAIGPDVALGDQDLLAVHVEAVGHEPQLRLRALGRLSWPVIIADALAQGEAGEPHRLGDLNVLPVALALFIILNDAPLEAQGLRRRLLRQPQALAPTLEILGFHRGAPVRFQMRGKAPQG